jgi:hypothetical protein
VSIWYWLSLPDPSGCPLWIFVFLLEIGGAGDYGTRTEKGRTYGRAVAGLPVLDGKPFQQFEDDRFHCRKGPD